MSRRFSLAGLRRYPAEPLNSRQARMRHAGHRAGPAIRASSGHGGVAPAEPRWRASQRSFASAQVLTRAGGFTSIPWLSQAIDHRRVCRSANSCRRRRRAEHSAQPTATEKQQMVGDLRRRNRNKPCRHRRWGTARENAERSQVAR